jgi:hypothetical protein
MVQALQAIVASGASLSPAAIAAPGKSLVAGAGIASTLVIVAAIWLQGGFRGGETTPPVSSPPGNPLAQGPTVGAQPGNAPALTQDGADQISAARGGDAASVTKTHEVMYTGWVVDEQGPPSPGRKWRFTHHR